ncbi:MAG: hypothetical protein IH851_13085 [Armatimonadetes bacterium]|nr:hypothetical protein [Armatimonadota bacterium]
MMNMSMTVRHEWWPQTEEEQLSAGGTVWVARHPELIGVVAQGETEQEAIERFQENAADLESELKASGLPLPTPTRLSFELVVESTHMDSGGKVSAQPETRFQAEPVALA